MSISLRETEVLEVRMANALAKVYEQQESQRPYVLRGFRVSLWFERARQRRQLKALPPERLDDLGLSVEQVQHEVSKPFWLA